MESVAVDPGQALQLDRRETCHAQHERRAEMDAKFDSYGMYDGNGVRVPVTVLQVRFAFFVCDSLMSERVFVAVGELPSHSKHQNG